jgi:hypothetical protein
MKKSILLLLLFILISSFASASTAAPGDENLIIPQSDKIYTDLYNLASDGYITSAAPEHFKYDPISSYEAAGYICEAILASAKKSTDEKGKKVDMDTLRKYYEIYKAKAADMYAKSNELNDKIKEVEAILANADISGFKAAVDDADAGIFDISEEYKLTTFRGIPPFKVMGMLQARWQDVESFGVSHIHHTSLGGTMMQLWTEGVVTPDVSFKLNLTFERPANEAEKANFNTSLNLPEFWGTGQRFLDKYTINLNAFNWMLSTGFFWEDITPFVAKQILSERPVLFDRDPYALEETARGHYENLFMHSFEKRGDIWSKHGWYGIGLYNMNLFGSMIKLMAGKAEKFDERWDKHFLYEFAGRWTYPIEVKGLLDNSEVSANFFNTSLDKGEVQTLLNSYVIPGQYPDDSNFPPDVDGFIQSATIAGGDFKANLFSLLSFAGEFEHGIDNGRTPKPYSVDPLSFTRVGNALYASAGLNTNIMKLEVKYTQIDPDYVATASAVIDTSAPTLTPTGQFANSNHTYAGDPTMLWNNMSRLSIFGNITIPNGFILLNYGTSSQINPTGKDLYMEHFLFGNRLNGSLYWHLFYSNYGTPGAPPGPGDTYDGFNNYNANNTTGGTTYHRMITDLWLTNKEDITSDYVGGDTRKLYNNASIEVRYALNKLVGLENNLFVEGYGELATLTNSRDIIVDYNPDKLLCQELLGAFVVYNLTRKINVMLDWGEERWVTNLCALPVDYADTVYGVGFDYDFAPRTALFLRAKRFIHVDKGHEEGGILPSWSGSGNNFNGWELFMELKNFF